MIIYPNNRSSLLPVDYLLKCHVLQMKLKYQAIEITSQMVINRAQQKKKEIFNETHCLLQSQFTVSDQLKAFLSVCCMPISRKHLLIICIDSLAHLARIIRNLEFVNAFKNFCNAIMRHWLFVILLFSRHE